MKRLIDLPFFGLSELPAFETRIYDDGNVRIEVQPGHRGLATIWDKNILDYAFQMMRANKDMFGSKISLRPDDSSRLASSHRWTSPLKVLATHWTG